MTSQQMIQQMDSQNWLPLVRHAEPFPSNKKSLAFSVPFMTLPFLTNRFNINLSASRNLKSFHIAYKILLECTQTFNHWMSTDPAAWCYN